MKRVAIYLRVSTSKQDTDNQRGELELIAKRGVQQASERLVRPLIADETTRTSIASSAMSSLGDPWSHLSR